MRIIKNDSIITNVDKIGGQKCHAKKKQALKEKDMKEKMLNVKDIEPLSRKRTSRKNYARNTFVTPVFERSGKDWESLKTTVLLQMLIKLVVINVMPKETGIKRTKI